MIHLGLTTCGKWQGAADSISHPFGMEAARSPLLAKAHVWRQRFPEFWEKLKLESFGGRVLVFEAWELGQAFAEDRWAAARAARVYFNEALALVAKMRTAEKDFLLWTVFQTSVSAKNLSVL